MTHPGSDGTITQGPIPSVPPEGNASEGPSPHEAAGPDPVVGAGIALLGIFVMAVGGARDMHYVFDAGVGIAIVGAVIFVLFIALSAMKQKRVVSEGGQPPA